VTGSEFLQSPCKVKVYVLCTQGYNPQYHAELRHAYLEQPYKTSEPYDVFCNNMYFQMVCVCVCVRACACVCMRAFKILDDSHFHFLERTINIRNCVLVQCHYCPHLTRTVPTKS
jgi:hypothetical protein